MNNIVIKNAPQTPIPLSLQVVIKGIISKSPLLQFESVNSEHKKFDVFTSNERLGCITLQYRDASPLIVINSRNIQKKRGRDRHSRATKNLREAIKIGLSVFRRRKESERATEIRESARYGVHTVWSRSMSSVRNFMDRNLMGVEVMKRLFRDDGDVITDYGNSLRSLIGGPDLNAAFTAVRSLVAAEYIKEALQNNALDILVELRDNFFILVSPACPENCKEINSTYELTQAQQEKVAILKIMKHDEPTPNVGVKFTKDLQEEKNDVTFYCILKGDTLPV